VNKYSPSDGEQSERLLANHPTGEQSVGAIAPPLNATEHRPWWRRRRNSFLLGLLLLIALLVVAVASRFSQDATQTESDKHESDPTESEHGGAIEVDDETAELIGIKTAKAVAGQIDESMTVAGKVMAPPNSQAIVSSKVEGRAVRILAEPGQYVGVGETLIVIDSPQIAEGRGQLIEAESRFKLAEQRLAQTKMQENRSAVIQAKNRLDLAEANFNRKKRLVELGASPIRELAEAETEFKNAKAEYDYQANIQVARDQQQAQSEVEQTRAVVRRLQHSLNSLGASPGVQGGLVSLASPLSGTVLDRHITVGEAVIQGKELLSIVNLSAVVVEAQIPESRLSFVKTGQKILALVPGTERPVFPGQIHSISQAVDPQTRTVSVRARIQNPGVHLKHQMAVEVRVITSRRPSAVLVPLSAIVEDEGVQVVYVREGNKYERRPVRIGTITHEQAEILAGVKAGELVVYGSAYQLKNMTKSEPAGGHNDAH